MLLPSLTVPLALLEPEKAPDTTTLQVTQRPAHIDRSMHADGHHASACRVLQAGAEALGAAFMLYFFVTIGAAAGSLSALAGCGWIALFIAVQLSTHLIITLGVGHLTSLPLQVCLHSFHEAG